MKRILLFFGVCLLLASPIFAPRVFAQTASEMKTLLYADAVSYGQAARFVLLAADIADLRNEDAFRYAMEKSWLPAAASQDAVVKLDGVSLLIMQAFNIQSRVDSDMAVSGNLLLFVVNRVLERNEGEL